jgi:hypothetical protein
MDEANRQEITVLLAEYNTLRTEELSARDYVARAWSLCVTAFMADVALFSSKYLGGHVCAAIIIFTIIFIILVIYGLSVAHWNDKNTQTISKRLRELEKEINELVGHCVLMWETYYGWGQMFPCRWGGTFFTRKKANPEYKGCTPPKA